MKLLLQEGWAHKIFCKGTNFINSIASKSDFKCGATGGNMEEMEGK